MTLVARLHNISGNTTRRHIETLVESIARVRRFEFPKPAVWLDIPLGRVEVELEKEEDAPGLYAKLHDAVIDGSRLYVSFARYEKERREPSSERKKTRRSRSRSRKERRSPPKRKERSRRRSPSRRRSESRSNRRRQRSPSSSSSSSRVSSPSWDSS